MKKSELRHIIRKIIQEQVSTGTEVYSPEGCEKIDLYNYIMTSGNYPTYDGTTGSYPNFTNDQVVLYWCGRCSAAQNPENGSWSFVSQVQPPQDEPNCKCCPQFENIDWPGEPDTDIRFRDPNKDVGPPKPPRPDFPFKDPDKFTDDLPKPPRPDFPFKDPDKDVPFEPPIPSRPERPITPITLGDDGDEDDIINSGAWYCAGDYDPTLNEVDPSASSTDCAYIANYDNPQQLTSYNTLEQCIAASSCTGPINTDDDSGEPCWEDANGECVDCDNLFDAIEGYVGGPWGYGIDGGWGNDASDDGTWCTFCEKIFYHEDYGIGSDDPELGNLNDPAVFNSTAGQGIGWDGSTMAYCTCCPFMNEWLNPLEESVKARLQKLANIQKK